MIETIRPLVEAYGPSGSEDHIRGLIAEMIDGLADETYVDAMGNLIAWKHSANEDAPTVMLSAHMDEIGLVVSHVDDDGYLRFHNLGGLLPATLTGQRVQFADGTIGVIAHEERSPKEKLDIKKMYIDVSADAENGHDISVGDTAGLYRLLDVRGTRLIAKSMDDRIGCAVQIEVMKAVADDDLPNHVAFVFSVQEEVGLRGAQTAAYGVEPDIGIAIDVTLTGDTPKADPPMAVSLGKGPASKIKDSRMIADADVVRLMVDAAEAAGVDYQREVLTGGTTDAAAMQLTRAGVKAGCLSIPCRFVHTTSETVDLDDVEGGVALLATLLRNAVQ
ncbi:MAG: M42 family metallopeptidase [Anaerolineae bacterium]